ncbi:MAG: hypothetical protein HY650_04320 [Acidobacteria bacterium]|nr:hypothetical protein [Acidobacteriota bacterium]
MIKTLFLFIVILSSSAVTASAQQWQLQTTIDGSSDHPALKAANKDVAWVTGVDVAYRTIDGGRNWGETAIVTVTENLTCISAANADRAIAGGGGPDFGGGNAKLYLTTDGGRAWKAVYTATGPASYWNFVHLFDEQNVIAQSDPPGGAGTFLIVKSSDGGETWTPIANPPSANSGEFGAGTSYFCFDHLNGWFGTATFEEGATGSRVFRTTDGGNTWAGFASGNTLTAADLHFVSLMVGIRTSNFAPFLTRSTDGGQSWAPVTDLPVPNVQFMFAAGGVSTPTQNQMWVAGRTGFGASATNFIITSTDGGATWREQMVASSALAVEIRRIRVPVL